MSPLFPRSVPFIVFVFMSQFFFECEFSLLTPDLLSLFLFLVLYLYVSFFILSVYSLIPIVEMGSELSVGGVTPRFGVIIIDVKYLTCVKFLSFVTKRRHVSHFLNDFFTVNMTQNLYFYFKPITESSLRDLRFGLYL